MRKLICIYKIQSIIYPNKTYVGSASRFNDRKLRHLKDLRLNRHPNKKLQNHFNKHGEHDLVFEILEPILFRESLIPREQYFMDIYKPWFNICKVAGNSLGRVVSEETKKKMRGHVPWNKGKTGGILSEEIRRNMSEGHIGRTSYWKGKKLSIETRKKMSDTQKRIGNKPPSWLNKNHSVKTREKLSLIKKKYYATR